MPPSCRSALYVPAVNAAAMAKAPGLACDVVIVDLEDSVLPERKPEALQAALAACSAHAASRPVVVRVNPPSSPQGASDLAALARSGALALLLPKVERPGDVTEAAQILDAAGAPASIGLWAMVETPRGILAALPIAEAHPRLTTLVLGTADLGLALRSRPVAEAFATARGLLVLAARASGRAVLDAPWFDLSDTAGLSAEATLARSLGFDGKTLIHPSQIEPVHRAFQPTEAECDAARRLLDAHDRAAAEGRGVATLDGRLVEGLHAEEARRILALAARA